jgi:indolepyruvate ferredoxin oxidoreductase beta subunit
VSYKLNKTKEKGGRKMTSDCVNVVIVGVGGQGVILMTRILEDAAFLSGHNVMGSELHGMAQRGGQVMSTVRIGDAHSSMIGTGEAHVILGLEPVETYRHLNLASKDTIIITSTNSIYPFTVTSGDEKYPDIKVLLDGLDTCSNKLVKLDLDKLILERMLPNIVRSSIMLGALIGVYPEFPASSEKLKEVINSVPLKYVKENLKAFDLGLEFAKSEK